jgi:hypothetical protein
VSKRDPDLAPLPRWKQKRAALVAWWRRSRDQRRRTLGNLRKAGRKGLTLAISVVGATLISYGVWSVHHPAGYAVAGALLWAIQWNYGDERGDG